MYFIEKDFDWQLYILFVNGFYSVFENFICEFYSILVNCDGVIFLLEIFLIVLEVYKEMFVVSCYFYYYLVVWDM